MNDVIGEFRLGEDLTIALDAVTGDTAGVTEIAARMRPARAMANRLVLDEEAPAIPLAIADRGTAGWTLSLAGAVTSGLDPGLYGIDARLTFPGAVEITERTAFVALSRAALS